MILILVVLVKCCEAKDPNSGILFVCSSYGYPDRAVSDRINFKVRQPQEYLQEYCPTNW